jgi:electron transfer flavoprotein alpha/beta subunit
VLALTDPPSRGDTQRIEDEGGDSAEKIVAYLAEQKLV